MTSPQVRAIAGLAMLIVLGSALSPSHAHAAGRGNTGGGGVVEKEVTKPATPGSTTKPKNNKPTSPEELERRKKEAEAARKRAEAKYQKCRDDALARDDFQALIRCGRNDGIISVDATPDLVNPGTVAREVVARLTLPGATPVFGPDPKINKIQPGTLLVGYPYWLTVPGESTLTTTATAQGLTLTMTATRVRVMFEMGDGTTKVCTQTQPWPGPDRALGPGNQPLDSPVCGHRYTTKGTMPIRGTAYWEVAWSGGGQSGMIPVMYTDTITLPVIEVHAVQR